MATTTAAETAGHPAEKEKVEKRRALGRGLESLLPGPRVVAGPAASAAVVPRQAGGAPVQGGPAAKETQVPHFVRDDNAEHLDQGGIAREDNALSAAAVGDIRAVVEMDAASQTDSAPSPRTDPALSLPKGVSAPHLPEPHLPAEGIEIHAQAESRMPSNLVPQLPLGRVDANRHQ